MKILVVGDFHGKFPNEILREIKKEKIDLVISVGDYPTFSLGKLFFKHVYGKKDIDLWDIIGKKKYKEMVLKDLKSGERVLEKLDKLPIQVITTLGNHDYPFADDCSNVKLSKVKWSWDKEKIWHFSKYIEKLKNVKKIDYSYFKFQNYVFIGARGHSFPGHVKSKAYKKHRMILEKLFKKFSKENQEGKLIFVTHVPLYETKLDLVHGIGVHEKAQGKHFGSKMFRRLVDKYKPVLHLCGHVEESRGKQKIGRTISVNCGSVHHGAYSIIDIQKGKVKNIKFVPTLK